MTARRIEPASIASSLSSETPKPKRAAEPAMRHNIAMQKRRQLQLYTTMQLDSFSSPASPDSIATEMIFPPDSFLLQPLVPTTRKRMPPIRHIVPPVKCIALVGMTRCSQEARPLTRHNEDGGLCEDHLNVPVRFNPKEGILMYWTLKELGFCRDICRYIVLEHWAPPKPPVISEDWDPCYRGHYSCIYRDPSPSFSSHSFYAMGCPCGDKENPEKRTITHIRHIQAVEQFNFHLSLSERSL